MTVNTFILLQTKLYSIKCCSFDLYSSKSPDPDPVSTEILTVFNNDNDIKYLFGRKSAY